MRSKTIAALGSIALAGTISGVLLMSSDAEAQGLETLRQKWDAVQQKMEGTSSGATAIERLPFADADELVLTRELACDEAVAAWRDGDGSESDAKAACEAWQDALTGVAARKREINTARRAYEKQEAAVKCEHLKLCGE